MIRGGTFYESLHPSSVRGHTSSEVRGYVLAHAFHERFYFAVRLVLVEELLSREARA